MYYLFVDTLLPLLAFALLGLIGLTGFGLLCYGGYVAFTRSVLLGVKLMGAGLLCGVLGNVVFWFLLFLAFKLNPHVQQS